jgi:hypothetical protein
MRHRDTIDASLPNKAIKEAIPQPPRRIFDVPALYPRNGRHIFAAAKKGKFEPASERCDKLFIPIGFRAPQAVVEMHYGQANAFLPAEFLQNRKQRNRVRATRDGYSDMIARPPHVVARDSVTDSLDQVAGHVLSSGGGHY